MRYRYLESPVGRLLLAGNKTGLAHLAFAGERRAGSPLPEWREDKQAFGEAAAQLEAYFAGRLERFSLALAPRGTAFQLAAWRALQAIPFGQVLRYADLATRIEKPKAVRAVGAANGANPLAIVIPCHRLVGSDGSLTGFAGGLAAKALLLRLEGHAVEETARGFRLRDVDPG